MLAENAGELDAEFALRRAHVDVVQFKTERLVNADRTGAVGNQLAANHSHRDPPVERIEEQVAAGAGQILHMSIEDGESVGYGKRVVGRVEVGGGCKMYKKMDE